MLALDNVVDDEGGDDEGPEDVDDPRQPTAGLPYDLKELDRVQAGSAAVTRRFDVESALDLRPTVPAAASATADGALRRVLRVLGKRGVADAVGRLLAVRNRRSRHIESTDRD